jgi:hypothetical protein
MKKLIFAVLALVLLAAPVLACECTPMCPTVDNGVNLFQAPTDKDVITCPNVCGRVPGSIKYDGKSLTVVCPCTGEGFDCTKPRGQKLIPWFLCDCDMFDELEVKEPIGIAIEILTPGVKFYSQASIHNPAIDVWGFKSEKDYCKGPEFSSNYTSLPYHFDDGARRDVLITNAKRNLFRSGQLYLGICIPAIEIDQRIVPINTMIKIRISLYRNKYICGVSCGAEICPCIAPVAFLGCFQCCAVSSYIVADDAWWNGVALTNISSKKSLVVMAFVGKSGKQLRLMNLDPGEVKTFIPADLGVTIDENMFLAVKATTSIKLVTFGGCDAGVFALPGTPCGCFY